MKKGLTKIVFILDKSGSMESMKYDAIGGFNAFLNEQKKVDGEVNMTVIFFNGEYEPWQYCVDINDIEPLTSDSYVAWGGTALLDAVGQAIDDIGYKLNATHEEEKPEKVVFVIMTDGEENCSALFTSSEIKAKIEHQTNKYSWQFIFLGCNQDAWQSSNDIGICNYSNVAYTGSGINNMYTSLNNTITSYRVKGTMETMPNDIK